MLKEKCAECGKYLCPKCNSALEELIHPLPGGPSEFKCPKCGGLFGGD